MPTLSMAQMEMYAASAGLPNPRFWAALGKAESGGRTYIVNSIGATGVWQINQPVWKIDYPTWTKEWLKDPGNNARAAKIVYDKQGLSAWEAYTNDSYQQFYGGRLDPAAGSPCDLIRGPAQQWCEEDERKKREGGGDSPFGALGAIGDALGILKDAGNWISQPRNWARVAYSVAGVALVVAGLTVMARPATQPLMKAVKKAGSVTPGGRVVKIASRAGKTAA